MKLLHHLFLLFIIGLLPFAGNTQKYGLEVLKAEGLNQTTGKVIELTVKNTTDEPITLAPGWYYVPGRDGYQGYIVYIPEGIVIPPGGTVPVPLSGYCTHLSAPPLPTSTAAPDFASEWIMVAEPGETVPANGQVPLVPDQVRPPFTPAAIPEVVSSPGFTPFTRPDESPADIVVVYPGTDQPINGTINLDENPADFAPLVASIVRRLEEAAPVVHANPEFSNPFSGDPTRNLPALTQHGTWRALTAIFGGYYTFEQFQENTYQSFEKATGIAVEELPEGDQEQVSSGVVQFWDGYTAVGIEAKVFVEKDRASPADGLWTDPEGITTYGETEIGQKDCSCDKLQFQYYTVSTGDKPHDTPSGRPSIQFPLTKIVEFDGKEETITYTADNWPNVFNFYFKDIILQCSCSEDESCMQTEGSVSVKSDTEEKATEPSANGEYRITVRVAENDEKTFKVTIKGKCASVNCDEATCEKVFVIKIVRKSNEDEVQADEVKEPAEGTTDDPQEDGTTEGDTTSEGTGNDTQEGENQDTSSQSDEETEQEDCSCDKVEFQYMSHSIGIKPHDTPSGRPGIQFPSKKSYEFDGKEETITYTTDNWPNRFTFHMDDIVIHCSCTPQESCTLTEGSLSVGSEAGEVTSKDGKNSIVVEVPEDQEKTFKVTIQGSCASANCNEAVCKKVLVFKIVRKSKEDEVQEDAPQEDDGGVKEPATEGSGADENNGQGDGDSNEGNGSQPDQQDGQPEDVDDEEEGDQCECQNLTYQYKATSMYMGDLDAPSGQPTIAEYTERAFPFDGQVGKATHTLARGHNQVTFRFKDVVIRCACADGTCTLTEGSIAITSDTGKVKIREGVTSVTVDAKGNEDQKIRVTIKGQCGSDDCLAATCTKVIELTIKHPEE